MPRRVVKDNNRIALRVQAADKAVIMRAVAVAKTDMTDFILRAALREARSVVEAHELFGGAAALLFFRAAALGAQAALDRRARGLGALAADRRSGHQCQHRP